MLHSSLYCNISADRVTRHKIPLYNICFVPKSPQAAFSRSTYFTCLKFDHAIHQTWRSITRRESSKSITNPGNSARLVRVRACGRASVVCGHHVSSYARHAGSPGEKGELGPTGPPGLPGEKGARGKQGKRVSFSEVLRPPPTIDQSNPIRPSTHPFLSSRPFVQPIPLSVDWIRT